jgi:TetR/AcrR family acrAB operon transcriptional repressor
LRRIARSLDAAGRVFRDLGYSGASLDAIAQEAGFSKGAVYSHFTSKADLFLSLLEDRISRRLERQLAAVRSPAVDGTGLLREVFQASPPIRNGTSPCSSSG